MAGQTENSARLKWNNPKSDGGSKVTAYQVEMKAPDSDVWEVVNDYPVKGNEFTVDKLQTGKPYEFRVKAKNAAGWGDYAKLDRPVTLKPDSGMLRQFSVPVNVLLLLSATFVTRHAGTEKSRQELR